MQGKTFRALEPRRPVRRFIRGLSRNRAEFTSRRLSARRIRITGISLLRHELRTPLTGILGMSELLRDSGLAGEQRGLVLALRESARQMDRLIQTMATAAPASGGGGMIRLDPTNGLKLLEQVIRAHWPAALKKGIGLHLIIDHRLSENWCTDAASLRQLLDNLLANAIKFTHSGYVLVDVRGVGPHQQGRCNVELRVRDTGIGIAGRAGRRVYTAGVQGNGAVHQRYGGSGLGLFVCQRIAARLGGGLRHYPCEGGGTCFEVALPGTAAASAGAAPRLRPALLAGLHCKLGLEEPINQVVTNLLRRIGVQVSSFGGHALQRLPNRCDAVICDSRRIGASLRASQTVAGCGRPVLLSPYLPVHPSPAAHGDEHKTTVMELPQPVLQSNLEPLMLQLALQRAMQGRI